MSNTQAPHEHCRATRHDGSPCQGRAIADGLCFAHSAATTETRQRGGKNRSHAARAQKAMPERLRPIAQLLETSMVKTFQGTMKPQQATALAALAGAYVRVIQTGEFEERLRALETAASA